jgi:tRNA A-37 threonylcarbamoyl transferase component Bud32
LLCSYLSDEYKHNKIIFQEKKDVAVVKAIELNVCESGQGAGMLMEECGTAVLSLTRQKIKFALDALASIHSTKHHHGDARIANLLICTGIYKWCDMQYAYIHDNNDARKMSFGRDIMTLMSSLSIEAPFDSTNFKEILDGYAKTQETEQLLKFILNSCTPTRTVSVAVEADEADAGDAGVIASADKAGFDP